MAQIDRSQRRDSPRTPTTPDRELLRISSTPISPRQYDPEEDHGHQSPKKSVLTKVKERAKKLKHSLSLNKKKHNDDYNTTPSWGVSLDEDEDEEEEEDAEYLGAPMYESELAPESYKETARQRPRVNPVISEKPILPSKMEKMTVENPPICPNSKSIQAKLNDGGDHSSPRKTVTETVTQKTLTPILETVTEELEPPYNSAISKIQGLTIANNSPTKEASQTTNNNNNSNSSSPSASQSSILSSPKKLAVSVKDYLLNKFEPAEEDRALSRAISEAMTSPSSAKRNSSPENNNNNGETSVADKVREAVASLLRNHQHQHQNQQLQSPPAPKTAVLTRSDTTPLMPRHIPISTNPHEVEEEENLGRILQAN